MTCNDKCIHYPVCEQKKFEFANIEECQYYYDSFLIFNTINTVGKWIFHKDFNESCRYSCNQCGNLNNIPSNFCPNCGAKMQKGNKNDTGN